MADVLFKKGLQANYDALTTKVATTFYYTTDEKNLYIGDVKLDNQAEITAAVSRIATNESSISSLKSTVETLNGADTVEGSVKKQIKDAIATSEAKLKAIATSGAASDVTIKDDNDKFTATNVEDALAELYTAIGTSETNSAVTLAKADAATEGSTATYVLSQGGSEVGKIEIPKDMVATEGELVYPSADAPITVDGTSVTSGTYIKMTIANGTPFYINVADLIEYNSVDSTSEIALAQSDDHTITATLVDGGISTAKIADKAVTKDKLGDAVQTSLGLADTSLQASDKTELEGKITTAQSAADAAQSDVDALEAVVGTAAVAADETTGTAAVAATGIFKKIDDAVAAQATTDAGQNSRLDDLESAIGAGGSVSSQISAAIADLDADKDAVLGDADTDTNAVAVVSGVTEVDGKISSVDSVAVDKAGAATAVKTALIGESTDAKTADTVNGAKAYADAAVDAGLTWQEF